ncbi:ornithine--oxo-acid transaminase [Arsenicicoccus piscis]|uniref:ornithine aminotransferase n=1 Tax=Arsenicicoccus piscis TaxID=673954 RepID=A0ABQ6HML1_9MICO|nr:ornithine--oxo-acid transaminase [Arsenicicoccus piscis]MCH8628932.1 ornithine--oxo-acid transaminase [Arsenicicoccus piscis]GMA19542.1 ornithine--oxo-acid transaminase [Arsenicicoccus piscis]
MSHDHTTLPVSRATADQIELAEEYGASNYHPLPVVLATGEGAWVTDVDGHRYLDALAGYSALNFGHGNPELLEAARTQLERITLTSRAFYNDQLGPFCEALAQLTGKDKVLPMNTGAEAVETALKVARRWGYQVKGVPENRATILVMDGNFHGRTTTIVSFSTDEDARSGFGPYTPGFQVVPYGDLAACRDAIDALGTVVAVLVEPIQGEGGVVVPPADFLPGLRALCDERQVLLMADEIQSGLGRTGRTFACDLVGVVPDVYILGKALGGGIVPVSAIAADRDVMDVITPGSHGSTFGGNPLAAAVGHQVVRMLSTGVWQERAARLGAVLDAELATLVGHGVLAYRCRGLWAGVDVDPALMSGRELCERLVPLGVLMKDTHGSTVRIAPPLTVTEDDVRWLVAQLRTAITG